MFKFYIPIQLPIGDNNMLNSDYCVKCSSPSFTAIKFFPGSRSYYSSAGFPHTAFDCEPPFKKFITDYASKLSERKYKKFMEKLEKIILGEKDNPVDIILDAGSYNGELFARVKYDPTGKYEDEFNKCFYFKNHRKKLFKNKIISFLEDVVKFARSKNLEMERKEVSGMKLEMSADTIDLSSFS